MSKCIINDKPVTDTSNYLLFTDPPLEISKNKKIMDNYFGQFPVMRISFSCGLIETMMNIKSERKRIISDTYKNHRYLIKSSRLECDEKEICKKWCSSASKKFDDSDTYASLKQLSFYLEKHFKRKIVVLVDEYDALCSQLLFKLKSEEEINNAIYYFISILGCLLKDNSSVHLGFVTGISFICTTGLSTITNLQPYKFLQNTTFAKFYGLSDAEVDHLLKFVDITYDKDEIKAFYNGYEFEGKKLYLSLIHISEPTRPY